MSPLIAGAPAATASPTSTSTWRSTCSGSPGSSTASRAGSCAAPPPRPTPRAWSSAWSRSRSLAGSRREGRGALRPVGRWPSPHPGYGLGNGWPAGGAGAEAEAGAQADRRGPPARTCSVLASASISPASAGTCRSPATPSARSTTCASRPAPRMPSQDHRIVLVVYNDETLAQLGKRSPLDRRDARAGAARARRDGPARDRHRHPDRPGPARGRGADRRLPRACARRPSRLRHHAAQSRPDRPWQEQFLRDFLRRVAPGRCGRRASGWSPTSPTA